MTTKRSQLEKIEDVLLNNTQTPGVTAAFIAKFAHVPKSAVSKRISELRETYDIYTNYRVRNGQRKAYYRLAN